jgi:hypothetical protein
MQNRLKSSANQGAKRAKSNLPSASLRFLKSSSPKPWQSSRKFERGAHKRSRPSIFSDGLPFKPRPRIQRVRYPIAYAEPLPPLGAAKIKRISADHRVSRSRGWGCLTPASRKAQPLASEIAHERAPPSRSYVGLRGRRGLRISQERLPQAHNKTAPNRGRIVPR